MKNFNKEIKSDFFRFIIIGLLSNTVNIVVYILSYKVLNIDLFISSFCGYLCGLIISFHFGRTWIFDNYNAADIKNVFLFLLVYFIGGIGMAFIIKVLTDTYNVGYIISWIFGAVYATLNNYFGLKTYVFGKK